MDTVQKLRLRLLDTKTPAAGDTLTLRRIVAICALDHPTSGLDRFARFRGGFIPRVNDTRRLLFRCPSPENADRKPGILQDLARTLEAEEASRSHQFLLDFSLGKSFAHQEAAFLGGCLCHSSSPASSATSSNSP